MTTASGGGPTDVATQLAFDLGWYKATAKTLERQLATAKAEIERLRESALDAVTRLENGAEAEDVVEVLAAGLYPAVAA